MLCVGMLLFSSHFWEARQHDPKSGPKRKQDTGAGGGEANDERQGKKDGQVRWTEMGRTGTEGRSRHDSKAEEGKWRTAGGRAEEEQDSEEGQAGRPHTMA